MRKTVNIVKKMRTINCKISIFCSFVSSIFTLLLMCLKKIVRYFRYKSLASLKGRLRAFWWFALNFVLWLRIFFPAVAVL